MVSDIAQNVGGNCTKPIVQAMGALMSCGLLGHLGRMTLSRGLFLALRSNQSMESIFDIVFASVDWAKLWVGIAAPQIALLNPLH